MSLVVLAEPLQAEDKVEEALAAAQERGDLSVMQRLLEVLAKPYEEGALQSEYRMPSGLAPGAYQTFCGT